jgi:hypothetical protein
VQGWDDWRSRRDRLRGSEAFRVLLKPIDAEKLLPHRRRVVPWWRWRATPESMAKDRVHERLSGQRWLAIGGEASEPV